MKEAAIGVNVQVLIAEQLSLELNIAEPEEVERRIKVCMNCPFRSQHTCTKCGCYYEFRAHLATKQCPVGMWESQKENS